MEQVKSPTEAVIAGRDTILLGTYNYMGMTFDPDVIAAGHAALDQASPRSSASATTASRISTSGWVACPRTRASWSCWRASIRCSATLRR
ncbi:hypothetical protein WR25_14049 [Diploscapter pachys]|uniref:Uncharacterized protein n=1 Tax=Diploscapter pachys TaxID=2018661 RepID=A0A2A2K6A5_9BILA|nr:hypothetical protein WR25_14049 [Diploscapter pachys]